MEEAKFPKLDPRQYAKVNYVVVFSGTKDAVLCRVQAVNTVKGQIKVSMPVSEDDDTETMRFDLDKEGHHIRPALRPIEEITEQEVDIWQKISKPHVGSSKKPHHMYINIYCSLEAGLDYLYSVDLDGADWIGRNLAVNINDYAKKKGV